MRVCGVANVGQCGGSSMEGMGAKARQKSIGQGDGGRNFGLVRAGVAVGWLEWILKKVRRRGGVVLELVEVGHEAMGVNLKNMT